MEETIDSSLEESRVFHASEEFRTGAVVSDGSIYERAAADPEQFWADLAGELDWIEPWKTVLEFEAPTARWFDGGKLNACVNCVDRHIKGPRKNKAAIIWEGEDGEQRVLTYRDLYREVSKFANVLRDLGVKKGDRIAIYLPMIPEAAIAMLACARIGAPHSVVFGGFSPDSLRDRIVDAQARVLITADGGFRRGNVVPLKRNADEALKECPTIEHVIMVHRVGDISHVPFVQGRDHWYHRLMECAALVAEPEAMESEDILYILYTSGSTGKPKGIVHSTAGYLLGVYATTKIIFDLKEDDVYWCTADVGWVTGHSYIIYGPLANGATCVMYEGAPDFPEKDRFWSLIEKYGVTVLYTAPTAIRSFMKWGTEWPARHDLTSLRLLGSVGEPINPEAWMWYYEHIGGERCPIVDTWWQTETGMILISPLPGITPLKPGSATHAFPGISAEVVDQAGKPVPPGAGGYLVINKPWPAMLRNLYGDPERFQQQYWSQYPGVYFTGDGARRDADGNFWLLGRVDDVMNVAGHRISTMEVESALVDHPAVAEAAVIGKKHDIKGQAIAAFVTVKEGTAATPELAKSLKEHVGQKIGSICRPDDIIFAGELPKTRSGKIMRRLLRDVAEGRALGDTTTLADPSVVESLKQRYEED
ncbi:MAG: acetate--CoA ligase [Armatimonadota bacterium]|nr:acetate--CoA ligase [Armatimonadota bacterium]